MRRLLARALMAPDGLRHLEEQVRCFAPHHSLTHYAPTHHHPTTPPPHHPCFVCSHLPSLEAQLPDSAGAGAALAFLATVVKDHSGVSQVVMPLPSQSVSVF